jgi:hypothetical protein
MDKADKADIVELMTEAFTDSEVIAKSALGMVINRSSELGHNPVVAILMLKVLCEIAMKDHNSKPMPGVPTVLQGKAMKWLEETIQEGIEERWTKHKAKFTG